MKKTKYKIKDLPKDFNLVGCYLAGRKIISGWNKGFWVKEKEDSGQLLPIFFKNFEQIKDWKVEVLLDRELELLLKNK